MITLTISNEQLHKSYCCDSCLEDIAEETLCIQLEPIKNEKHFINLIDCKCCGDVTITINKETK